MTNSGKFAHYGPSNTGYEVVYGSLEDCVQSAVAGELVRDEAWMRQIRDRDDGSESGSEPLSTIIDFDEAAFFQGRNPFVPNEDG